jgi:hypothetical protein
MIHVNVKMMNGELLQIEHDPNDDFYYFQEKVYTAQPEIPLGCLVLLREPENEDDSIENVTEVYDEDYLLAFVDTSLVTPVVECGGKPVVMKVKHDGEWFSRSLSRIVVGFRGPCDQNESSVSIVYQSQEGRFALETTFKKPTFDESASYKKRGLRDLYVETDETVWFETIEDCVRAASEKRRVPVDAENMANIALQFDNPRNWQWTEYWGKMYQEAYEEEGTVRHGGTWW